MNGLTLTRGGDNMLTFEIKEETKEKVLYNYYPEGGALSGAVSYDKKTGICNIVTLSKADRHQRYALKMFAKIRACAKEKLFPASGIVAWY